MTGELDEAQLIERVDALRDMRQFELARSEAFEATRLMPDSAALWSRLALIEYGRRDYEGAKLAAEQSLALDNSNASAMYVLAIALLELGNKKGAREVSARLIETYPEWPDGLIQRAFVVARTWRNSRELKEVTTLATRVIELLPESAYAHHEVANIYLTLAGPKDYGYLASAKEHIDAGLSVDPVHEGLLLAKAGMSGDAGQSQLSASVLGQSPDSLQARRLLHSASWNSFSAPVTVLAVVAVVMALATASVSWRIASDEINGGLWWVFAVAMLVWVGTVLHAFRASPRPYLRGMLGDWRVKVAVAVTGLAALAFSALIVAFAVGEHLEVQPLLVVGASAVVLALHSSDAALLLADARAVRRDGLVDLETPEGAHSAKYFVDRWRGEATIRYIFAPIVIFMGAAADGDPLRSVVAVCGLTVLATAYLRVGLGRKVMGHRILSTIWLLTAAFCGGLGVYFFVTGVLAVV